MNFGISLSGMSAAQRAMSVTNQNISNMSTEGYARQRVEFVENGAAQGPGIAKKAGSGVVIKDIKMMTDEIMLGNYNSQKSTVGYFEGLESTLAELETVMGDYTTGNLGKLMTGFFNAWEELSKFPEESSYRYSLIGEAEKFTQKINEMSSELSRIKQSLIEKNEIQIDEVNSITTNLAEINRRIAESGKDVPNSLLNERNRLVEKLSGYMQIEVSYESNNPNIVSVRSGGSYLVDKEDSYGIRLMEDTSGVFLTNGKTKIDISSGSIKASIDASDIYLAKYESQLDKFSTELISQVNTIHSASFSINGDTGLNFLVGTSARNISINPILRNDASKIATSAVMGAEGNTAAAKNIANVYKQTVDLNMDFRNYVSSMSMGMAQNLNNASTQSIIQNEVLAGLGEQVQNVQGVNLEEEMTNLMMFQKYFTANSKAIKVQSEIADALFSILN